MYKGIHSIARYSMPPLQGFEERREVGVGTRLGTVRVYLEILGGWYSKVHAVKVWVLYNCMWPRFGYPYLISAFAGCFLLVVLVVLTLGVKAFILSSGVTTVTVGYSDATGLRI